MVEDDDRLLHMLHAAREAVALLGEEHPTDVRSERMLTLALVKLIEILGEAASRVSDERRSRINGIPWADIVATRNRLIHGYFDVDVDVVIATVRDDLPSLIEILEQESGAGSA